MNNNTRGFVALLFLEVLVPMTAQPTLNQATALSGEAAEERNRGAAQRAERWRGGAGGAMERGSISIPVYVS